MTTDGKINEKRQYDINREDLKLSALSLSALYLMGKEISPLDQNRLIEQAKFAKLQKAL